jgi:hypothetical protein
MAYPDDEPAAPAQWRENCDCAPHVVPVLVCSQQRLRSGAKTATALTVYRAEIEKQGASSACAVARKLRRRGDDCRDDGSIQHCLTTAAVPPAPTESESPGSRGPTE